MRALLHARTFYPHGDSAIRTGEFAATLAGHLPGGETPTWSVRGAVRDGPQQAGRGHGLVEERSAPSARAWFAPRSSADRPASALIAGRGQGAVAIWNGQVGSSPYRVGLVDTQRRPAKPRRTGPSGTPRPKAITRKLPRARGSSIRTSPDRSARYSAGVVAGSARIEPRRSSTPRATRKSARRVSPTARQPRAARAVVTAVTSTCAVRSCRPVATNGTARARWRLYARRV